MIVKLFRFIKAFIRYILGGAKNVDFEKYGKEKNCKFPSVYRQIFTFFVFCVKYIISRGKNVDYDEYCRRISVCNKCDFRKKNRCCACGCFLDYKAWVYIEQCPWNFW